jgi:hypothetical protein
MPEEEWEQLCKEVGMSTMQLRDERYDCVLHLVTAAQGATQYYTTEGHAARTEPPALARELDDRVKNNWVGHRQSKKLHVVNWLLVFGPGAYFLLLLSLQRITT